MATEPRTFRLNEMEELFDREQAKAKSQNPKVSPSVFLRYCIKKALEEEQSGMSPEEAQKLSKEIFELRKDLSKVGGNLNQIAQYFNIHEHLVESDLHKRHSEIQLSFKSITKMLNEVLNGLRRASY